jgi:hypothetical protein
VTIPTGLTRVDLAVAGTAGAVLAGTALHYGVPVWLLPLGALPALTVQIIWWLAGYRDTRRRAGRGGPR